MKDRLIFLLGSVIVCIICPGASPYTMASSPSSPISKSPSWESQKRTIPNIGDESRDEPLIIGYAHNIQSGKAEQAIQDGADAIIWSFFHLHLDGLVGAIKTDLDLDGIRKLRDKYQHVIHLAAFGGWNGPHPPEFLTQQSSSEKTKSLSGGEWCEVFIEYNKSLGYLFDGVDWDYEGHDDVNSATAKFTHKTLDIMADFSIAAKKYGMIVSMAPAESYLDSAAKPGSVDTIFSLDLNLLPRAWTSSEYNASIEDRDLITSVGFMHAGRQCYAYVLAKAGIETFDWVSVQFYEAYSPYAHDVSRKKLDHVDAIMIRLKSLLEGYTVSGLPLTLTTDYQVKIPANKLVIGVANGWADGVKFCKVPPASLRLAYDKTKSKFGEAFLGVMFWTIEEEGDEASSRLTHLLKNCFQEKSHGNGEL